VPVAARHPAPPARRLLARVAHLVVPASCAACGSALAPARPPFGLCLPCRGRLVPATAGAACPCCGAPVPEPPPTARPAPRCAACRRRPPAFERLVAPWSYRPPLREVVRALKFGRLAHLGERLARPLGAELRAAGLAGAGPPACQAVVPVALHWRRRLARGYDQAARIAAPLAGELGLSFHPALVRVRGTPPQTGLARSARRANVRGAFRVRRSEAGRVAGRRVLLVDDVTTTGATLDDAARALLAAGAATVVAVAVARTPEGPSGRRTVPRLPIRGPLPSIDSG